mgnify:CR=1 FL=1
MPSTSMEKKSIRVLEGKLVFKIVDNREDGTIRFSNILSTVLICLISDTDASKLLNAGSLNM